MPRPTLPPSKPPARAAADKRLAWFHADLRRRTKRFRARLADVARDEHLLADVRAALQTLPSPPTTADEVRRELHWTGPGRRAVAAIGRALAERRMPAELAAWIAWVALSGEDADELLAADYREEKVGGHARQVREPVTGDTYLEIRVPAEWSTKTIVAALPYLRDPTIFPSVVSPDGAGGRPRHVESEDALDLARRFDAAAAAKLGGKRLSVKVWLGRWQTWLDAELGDAPHPKAAYLWRTAVKAAVEGGAFVPATLDARRLRRSG